MRHLILIALVALAFVAPVAEGQEVRVADGWMLVGTLDSWTVATSEGSTTYTLGVGLVGGRVDVAVATPITLHIGGETIFDVTLGELVHHREALIGAVVRLSGVEDGDTLALRSLRPIPRRIARE